MSADDDDGNNNKINDVSVTSDYDKDFDTIAFLKAYFTIQEARENGDVSPAETNMRRLVREWVQTFATGKLHGERLLEFGSGPSIHTAIAASRTFREIYLSDYVSSNMQAIHDWLDRAPSSRDWVPFFKLVAEQEGNGITWTEVEDRARECLKGTLECDITKQKPFLPNDVETFDCIVSSLCLEAACETKHDFKQAVKKLANLLKPGGHIVVCGVFNDSHYNVGKVKFPVLSLDFPFLEEAFQEADFGDVETKQLNGLKGRTDSVSLSNFYFLKARKCS